MDPGPAIRLTESLVADGTLPSAVLGISDARGTRILHAVRGPLDRRVEPHSVFFLASVTKPIVATAVVQLVDEGRLDLHGPIRHWVPGYQGGRRDRVTPWHILTHTSGIPDLDLEQMRRSRPSYRALLAKVVASEPTFEPGTRYAYASDGFYLLAELLRTHTGMGFEEALRTRVLAPLAMDDTRFDVRPVLSRTVDVHGIGPANMVTRRVITRFLAAATLPGGGLFGTAEDLLRFGRALLSRASTTAGAPRVLSEEAIELMTREHTMGIPELLEDGTSREPHYALGWHKPRPDDAGRATLAGVPIPAGMEAFTHGGISGTRLWVDRVPGLVVTVLSNQWALDHEPVARVVAAVYRGWPSP
jgi:CubicO group peptidase (beta-lactamase class C family)